MKRLDGQHAAFRTAAERRELIGCTIEYLRHCDIDRSGRGYIFPRIDIVEDAKGKNLFLANGTTLTAGELSEVVIVKSA